VAEQLINSILSIQYDFDPSENDRRQEPWNVSSFGNRRIVHMKAVPLRWSLAGAALPNFN
jgi:hypothetical protein